MLFSFDFFPLAAVLRSVSGNVLPSNATVPHIFMLVAVIAWAYFGRCCCCCCCGPQALSFPSFFLFWAVFFFQATSPEGPTHVVRSRYYIPAIDPEGALGVVVVAAVVALVPAGPDAAAAAILNRPRRRSRFSYYGGH